MCINFLYFLVIFWDLLPHMPQEASRWPQDRSRWLYRGNFEPTWTNLSPSWLQVTSRWAQVGLKLAQVGPKLAQVEPKISSGRLQEALLKGPGRVLGGTWSQEALLEAPEVLKWPPNDLQEAILEAPEVPKWLPNDLKTFQNDPKRDPISTPVPFFMICNLVLNGLVAYAASHSIYNNI